MTNCCEIVIESLKIFNRKYNRFAIQNQMRNHPFPDSAMALQDILYEHNIMVKGYNIKQFHHLNKFTPPYILQIKSHEPLFSLIISKKNNYLIWYNPENHRQDKVLCKYFDNKITGNILTIKDSINSFDEKIKKTIMFPKEILLHYALPMTSFLIFIILFIPLYNCHYSFNIINFLLFLGVTVLNYLFYKDTGMIMEQPSLFCRTSKYFSCNNSTRFKINGITTYLAPAGLSFFLGTQYYLLLYINDPLIAFSTIALLSVFSTIIIPVSLLTQYRQRKFCLYCLFIIMDIILLSFISIYYNLWTTATKLSCFQALLIVFLCFLFLISLQHFTKKTVFISLYRKKLEKIKYNKDIFRLLLEKTDTLELPEKKLGIVLGEIKSPLIITEIINPKCKACSESIKELKRLIDYFPNIQINLIFLLPNQEDKESINITCYILALYKKHPLNALDYLIQMYHNPEFINSKDVVELNITAEELNKLKKEIFEMNNWCVKEAKIQYTPCLILGKKFLPNEYKPEDLKYVL